MSDEYIKTEEGLLKTSVSSVLEVNDFDSIEYIIHLCNSISFLLNVVDVQINREKEFSEDLFKFIHERLGDEKLTIRIFYNLSRSIELVCKIHENVNSKIDK